MFIVSIALFLAAILLFAGFASSLSATAQQTTTPLLPPPPSSSSSGTPTGQATSPSLTSPSLTSPPPLTPQEQEQLTRLQNVIAATNLNLDETEKQIGGIVYTLRWSDPVWVEPDSASVLVAYCLPGEFAESGQEILGGGVGFELEVLESYEVALPQNFTAWMMVIGNEDRQNRYPAAVGVICASDANDTETRVVSPQEQQQINNVVQQITTIQNRQITSIDQVINIINNNATTTTTPQNGNTTTTTTTPTAPSGRGEAPGATAPPECPGGSTFNPDTDQCENPISEEARCPPGFQFDPADDACVSIVDPPVPPVSVLCPPQTTFNPDTDQCKGTQTAPPTCPQGFDFNPATDQCEQIQTAPPAGPSSDGTITATANPVTYSGACGPSPLEFSGTITDNVGNRDVTYRFVFSTGATLDEQTIHFDQPGSQRVSYTAPGLPPQSLEGWWAIEIIQPVQLQSNQAEMRITCVEDGDITASLVANPATATYSGPCPGSITFHAVITDNVGVGDVGYEFFKASTAPPLAEGVIHFDQPGSQTVSFTETFGGPEETRSLRDIMHIEITYPIRVISSLVEYTINCIPSTGGAPQTLQAENDTTIAGTTTDDDEEEEQDTTTDGEGAEGDTGGGGTGDTENADQSPPAGTTSTDGEGAGDTTGGGTAGGTGTDGDEPQ